MNNKQEPYKFKSIYKFVEIIFDAVENGIDFWNFNTKEFIRSAIKFNKESLLHIYVKSTLYDYYLREFHKDGDLIEEDDTEWWTR